MDAFHLENFHLADQTVSSKGQKSCALTVGNKPVTFQLGTGLRTRFGATSFDRGVDAPRRSLDFEIGDEDVLARLREIDLWAISYIAEHSDRLLKKKLTPSEVEMNYKPLVHTYGSSSGVKTKINLRGGRAATFWDNEGVQLKDPPADDAWQDCAYNVFCRLAMLYYMSGSFGWVLESTALQQSPHATTTCPFV